MVGRREMMAKRIAEKKPTTVAELRAMMPSVESVMARFEAQYGSRDVRAVATGIVKNADRVKWE